MIANEEFLSQLRKIFDLNLYEVKVWASILSRGVSTAGELSNISDVPRSRTYDILESLEKKGFIVMKLGKPIKFIALKPEEVIERVKKNMVQTAQDKAKRLERLKSENVIDELNTLYDKGIKFIEPADLSGSLKGRSNLYNHLDMMIKNSKKSATIVTTEEGLNRKMEALMPALEKAKKRGVALKIAAPITANNYAVAKQLSKVAEVRGLDKAHGRFAIIDDAQMMMMLLDDKEVHPNYDTGVWLSSDFLANSMSQIMGHAWSNFTPFSKVKVK